MWRTPEGHELARQIAFQERSMLELQRATALVGAVQLARQLAQPVQLTREQEAVFQKLAEDMSTAFVTGKFGRKHILSTVQLALYWRGQPLVFGWDAAVKPFDPQVRGPLAYVFGFHSLHHHHKPAEAGTLFRKALADAPPDSPVRRLAQAELDRLNKK
jgi:hypothetical protein